MLTVMRGIPGSGKTHHAARLCQANPGGVVRVSRDDFRRMLTADPSAPNGLVEDEITTMQEHAVRTLLDAGKHVIVDDTNLPHRRVRKWLGIAEDRNKPWEVADFTDVPLETCLDRNTRRDRRVPEEVIRRMHSKYVAGGAAPSVWEPLGVGGGLSSAPYVTDPTLPKAVIVDIDGTLAKMKDRSPYDYTRVDEDAVNWPVAEYLDALQAQFPRMATLLVSGRPEQARGLTVEWLDRHQIRFDHLLMRTDTEHDRRIRDDVVKLRIFNESIRDDYDVHSVLDDRKRVVQMWRALGLTVLQVDEGDF